MVQKKGRNPGGLESQGVRKACPEVDEEHLKDALMNLCGSHQGQACLDLSGYVGVQRDWGVRGGQLAKLASLMVVLLEVAPACELKCRHLKSVVWFLVARFPNSWGDWKGPLEQGAGRWAQTMMVVLCHTRRIATCEEKFRQACINLSLSEVTQLTQLRAKALDGMGEPKPSPHPSSEERPGSFEKRPSEWETETIDYREEKVARPSSSPSLKLQTAKPEESEQAAQPEGEQREVAKPAPTTPADSLLQEAEGESPIACKKRHRIVRNNPPVRVIASSAAMQNPAGVPSSAAMPSSAGMLNPASPETTDAPMTEMSRRANIFAEFGLASDVAIVIDSEEDINVVEPPDDEDDDDSDVVKVSDLNVVGTPEQVMVETPEPRVVETQPAAATNAATQAKTKAKAKAATKAKTKAKAKAKGKAKAKPERAKQIVEGVCWATRLQLRPNGCSKCRRTPGCTLSCWYDSQTFLKMARERTAAMAANP